MNLLKKKLKLQKKNNEENKNNCIIKKKTETWRRDFNKSSKIDNKKDRQDG